MKEGDYTEIICKGFCKFYKEGKEEVHCGGYELLRDCLTVKELKLLIHGIPDEYYSGTVEDKFTEFICKKCAFETDGCDFREGLDSPPCGGYIIISRLKFLCLLPNP